MQLFSVILRGFTRNLFITGALEYYMLDSAVGSSDLPSLSPCRATMLGEGAHTVSRVLVFAALRT